MTYSKAKRDYNVQYIKDNIKRIPLDVQKDHYETIKAAATAAGESVNGYIKRAIDSQMAQDSAGRLRRAAETVQRAGAVSSFYPPRH